MASLFSVRLLQQSAVGPPRGSVAASSLPLTFFDVAWIGLEAIERVYFFDLPHSTTLFVDAIIPNLKSSLSLALQHFYPLAGNLRRSPSSDDKYEIHYKDGDTVSFVVAESESSFQDLVVNHANDLHEMCSLVPKLEQSGDFQRLLALQATSFRGFGVAIGISFHHVLCDGSSIMHFVKTWASASASKANGFAALVSAPPLYDRSVIKDPHGLYSAFLQFIRSIPKRESPESSALHGVYGSFSFTKELIHKLKEIILVKASERRIDFHCSRFVIVCAYVFVCLVRAYGYMEDEMVPFVFVMDCRSRLRPPIEASYFGNCLRPCYATVKAGDLRGADGLLVGSEAIGRAIREASRDIMKDSAEWLSMSIDAIETTRIVSVAGSPKLGAYDVDFGWGRPRKTVIPSIRRNGAIAISERRDEQDGVEIGLVLPKELMNKFSLHFFGGLKNI